MSEQGPVISLKEFAARRANKEDRHRLGKEVVEILRIDKVEERQRRLREVVKCAHPGSLAPVALSCTAGPCFALAEAHLPCGGYRSVARFRPLCSA